MTGRISPDQAYRDAPPLPQELGAVMGELAAWIERGRLGPAERRAHLLRSAATTDRSSLLADETAKSYGRQRNATAREAKDLAVEARQDAERCAAELAEHDLQHDTTPTQAAGLTGRDYVRAAYLAAQAKETER